MDDVIRKSKPALRVAAGLTPGPIKPSPVMAGQRPAPALAADKRGDTGRGPLPKTADGADRFVRLPSPGIGKQGPLTSGDVIKGR